MEDKAIFEFLGFEFRWGTNRAGKGLRKNKFTFLMGNSIHFYGSILYDVGIHGFASCAEGRPEEICMKGFVQIKNHLEFGEDNKSMRAAL